MSEDVLSKFLNKKGSRAIEYRDIIEGMMGDYGSYHYAEDTLLGILDYIEEVGDITDNQIFAVNNIRNNPARYARN